MTEKEEKGTNYYGNKSQRNCDEAVTSQKKYLGMMCCDEAMDPKANVISTLIMLRKFWFRIKLFGLYRQKCEERDFGVLFLGSGRDTLGDTFSKWKIVKVDREEYENVIQLDINKDYERIGRIVKENGIKLIVMEGLTYYLHPEVIEYIMKLICEKDLFFLCDAFDKKGIEYQKGKVDVKSSFPFDLAPEDTNVCSTEDFISVFGEKVVEIDNDKLKIFFVSNF